MLDFLGERGWTILNGNMKGDEEGEGGRRVYIYWKRRNSDRL